MYKQFLLSLKFVFADRLCLHRCVQCYSPTCVSLRGFLVTCFCFRAAKAALALSFFSCIWSFRLWKRVSALIKLCSALSLMSLSSLSKSMSAATFGLAVYCSDFVLVYMEDRGFSSFASNMIRLSNNETKWSSLLARTSALIL